MNDVEQDFSNNQMTPAGSNSFDSPTVFEGMGTYGFNFVRLRMVENQCKLERLGRGYRAYGGLHCSEMAQIRNEFESGDIIMSGVSDTGAGCSSDSYESLTAAGAVTNYGSTWRQSYVLIGMAGASPTQLCEQRGASPATCSYVHSFSCAGMTQTPLSTPPSTVSLPPPLSPPLPPPPRCPGQAAAMVTLTTRSWGSEISWNIDGTITNARSYGNNAQYTQEVCISSGSHTLTCSDSFGDGWHGASVDITGEDGVSILSNACSSFGSGRSATATFTVALLPPATPLPPQPLGQPSAPPLAAWQAPAVDLLAVSNFSGVTYYSGRGAGWTIPQYSTLVSYACNYDLCTVTAPIDGTPANPHGAALDFAGPGYQTLPYTYTIDMGQPHTFTHWRVSGQDWYRFGTVHLRYQPAGSSEMQEISGSHTDYTLQRMADGFAYGEFDHPVTATRWQVVITSHTNTDTQSRYQCYLTEVQFGLPSGPSPSAAPPPPTPSQLSPVASPPFEPSPPPPVPTCPTGSFDCSQAEGCGSLGSSMCCEDRCRRPQGNCYTCYCWTNWGCSSPIG